MQKSRLEAFSDGVIAIIITIMVLELRPPHHLTYAALIPLIPVGASYLLSFAFVAIYWNNHHNLLHSVKHVNGAVLWANMHLLFWISLIPFATAWLGESKLKPAPVGLYGIILFAAAVAYFILARTLLRANPSHAAFAAALGRDFKGKISIVLYLAGIAMASVSGAISCGIYVLVALMWLIPDRRFARVASESEV